MAVFRGFSFNLLPGPSKEDIQKEEARDTSSLYIALFPVIAVLVWLALIVANSYVIEQFVHGWEKRISNQKLEISSFSVERKTNGELFQKTKALTTVITKHINPEEFFQLVEERIIKTSPDTIIKSYGREEGDKFNVTADAQNYEEVARIVYAFTSDPNFTDVKFKNVSINPDTAKVTFTLEFVFIGTTAIKN